MKIKICCMSSVDEANTAISAGADAVGLVSRMPSGPGMIPERRIARIIEVVSGRVDTFLLTSLTTASEIADQHERCPASTIQLVAFVERKELAILRDLLGAVNLVQVIHVRDERSIAEAVSVAPLVDALLLDSGNPNAAVAELGGTGRVHNWELSREIVRESPVPVWLAGGLKASNAVEAMRMVRPYGLDLCSGVRSGGRLDEEMLREFVRVVRLESSRGD